MGNLLASFNAGVSGLHSAQNSLNTTSHNLANAQTSGYVRQQTVITDSFYQNSYGVYANRLQVGTGTTIVKTRQIRNTFLDEQYRVQLGREGFYNANLNTGLEIEDLLGELYGEQFSTSIDELWASLQSLSESPGDLVLRQKLVSKATQFVERSQVFQTQLNEYQTSLNTQVQKQVDQINNIVSKIKDLNGEIRKYEANGQSANDYRDKRNLYLDQLGEIIKFDVNEEKDGTISIYSESGFLLDSSNQFFLKTEYIGDQARLLKPVWVSGGDFFNQDSLQYSSDKKTDIGSLRGLMVARGNYAANATDMITRPQAEDYATDEEYQKAMRAFEKDLDKYNDTIGASIVMQTQVQVDTLVHKIVTAVNDALSPLKTVTIQDADGNEKTVRIMDEGNALIGDDENETMGAELFVRRNQERYTKTTVTIVNEDGTTEQKDVYLYNEEDKNDPYSLYTISQLEVNPDVKKNPSMLPTKNNKESGSYGGFAHEQWLKMADAVHETVGALDPNSTTTYNVFKYYNEIVGNVSVKTNIWSGIVENQETTVATIDDSRQDTMGVSTEEELSNLIKYQQCYNASSRYITTVASMLEYLVERLGG